MKRPSSISFLLACLAFLPTAAAAAQPVSITTVHGDVITTSGKPIPNCTVYLQGLTVISGKSPDQMPLTAVKVDSHGSFTWQAPGGAEIWPEPQNTVNGCCVLPADATEWTATPVFAPKYQPTQALQELLDPFTRVCSAKWVALNGGFQLIVTAPDTGGVSMQIESPDGSPLGNHTVELVDPPAFGSYAGGIVYTGETDSSGWIHTRWFPKLQTLQIIAPGVGFGATGSYVVRTGSVFAVRVPPLAKFATVSGTVYSKLNPNCKVAVHDAQNERQWYIRTASVDNQGLFCVTDVLPGNVELDLKNGSMDYIPTQIQTEVAPGEDATGLKIPALYYPHPLMLWYQETSVQKPSLHGIVTDIVGHPVAGATVYAAASFFGGMREYQSVLSATTAADGSYAIANLPVGFNGTGTEIEVVAVTAGEAPVIKFARVDGTRDQTTTDVNSIQANLVLGGPGGSLEIHVLDKGEPSSVASVRLTELSGDGLFNPIYVGSARGSDSATLRDLLEPSAQVDANGVAHFAHLCPGPWDLVAGAVKDPSQLFDLGRGLPGQSSSFDSAHADGVVVHDGETTTHTLTLIPHDASVTYRVLAPDGSPPVSSSLSLNVNKAGNGSGWATFASSDPAGSVQYTVGDFGLWTLETDFRDAPLDSCPVRTEPYYAASSTFAVSPALSRGQPQMLHAVEREPGSLHVELVGANGNPVSGGVSLEQFANEIVFGLSTGNIGAGTFTDLPSGQYSVRGWQYGASSPETESATQTVTVVQGKTTTFVAHLPLQAEITQPILPPLKNGVINSAHTNVTLGMGGLYLSQTQSILTGRVTYTNGKPASGARLAIFDPSVWQPVRAGITDALGNVNEANVSYDMRNPDNPPAGSPSNLVVAAILPGACGAAISTYVPGKPITLTLPAAVDLNGSVTVDGASIGGSTSEFEVRAEFQGKGKLNDFLSIQTTPQADGAFSLRGLTPGKYLVQAARDRIWMSKSVTVTVGSTSDLNPITLDIPAPGAPVLFKVTTPAGKPLADTQVAFDPPAGPLSDIDWPKSFTTDGAGELRFDGLTAGSHSISVNGHTYQAQVPVYLHQERPVLTEIKPF